MDKRFVSQRFSRSDDLYLNYLARFVKSGGVVGIAGAGVVREIEGAFPEHLRARWYLGYVRAVGRRKPGIRLPDPVLSVPVTYSKARLLLSPT